MAEPLSKYPDLLSDLAAKWAALLVDAGIAHDTAEQLACDAVDALRRDWGGEIIYIPMGRGHDLAQRNAEIRRRVFAGEEPEKICREFNLSPIHVRRILKSL